MIWFFVKLNFDSLKYKMSNRQMPIHTNCSSDVNSSNCDAIARLFDYFGIPYMPLICPCDLTCGLSVNVQYLDKMAQRPVEFTQVGNVLFVVPR
jgi:hypothetical protein